MIDLNCFCKQWRWCLKTCRFSQQDNVFLAAERHLTLIAHLLSLARKFLKHFNLFQCATTHIPCQAQCHNHFDSLYLLEKEKLQKKSLWSWSLMVLLASGSNGLKFSAFETVWIFTLTAIFKPLQSFSKFPFFQICLNFPMSKLQKTRSILSPPLRTVGTVLTSWSWLSPLSSCLRKASAVFPCSDHSVYSGPLQDHGDNDGNEDSNSNEFKWWWLNQW